jgi:hypothetical protein
MIINPGDFVRVKRDFRKKFLVDGRTGVVLGILDVESEVPWLTVRLSEECLICIQSDEVELMAWRDARKDGGTLAG